MTKKIKLKNVKKDVQKNPKKPLIKSKNFSKIIDIISVATPCTIEENRQIKQILKNHNLVANFFYEKENSVVEKPDNFLAICDPYQRFLSFKNAAENEKSQIIWCNRGGYGSAEILPFLYKMPKPKHQKILIGFSDIVAIATFVQRHWNWQVVCAPMLIQIARNAVSQQSQNLIFDFVKGDLCDFFYDLKLLKGAGDSINREIVGGCVSVLSNNYATKNQLDWHNKILFLEDEGEDGERLDRYLTQIAFMINEKKSRQPKAILLGNFMASNEFGNPQFQKISIAIKRFIDKVFDVDIWQESTGCLGHSFIQEPLILGLKTQIQKIENSNGKLHQKFDLSFFID
jgi:muramoyltetrapeptide carboxypeptidase